MGIKAPAMIQRPAREQLQWPAQESRTTKVPAALSSLSFIYITFLSTHVSFLVLLQSASNKRPRGAENGRSVI
jgi:hypothetical protein